MVYIQTEGGKCVDNMASIFAWVCGVA